MQPDSDHQTRPSRECAECGKPFSASVNREINLELCKPCSDRQEKFNAVCPPLYRASDPDRLPCGPDKLQQVLAWKLGERGLLLHGATRKGLTAGCDGSTPRR